jgi:hypothetical protein
MKIALFVVYWSGFALASLAQVVDYQVSEKVVFLAWFDKGD